MILGFKYMRTWKTSRPTTREKLYESELFIYLTRRVYEKDKLKFCISKNKNGPNDLEYDETNMQDIIDILCDALTRVKFQDGNSLFQNSMKEELSKEIKRILMIHDKVPEQSTIKKYVEGGK